MAFVLKGNVIVPKGNIWIAILICAHGRVRRNKEQGVAQCLKKRMTRMQYRVIDGPAPIWASCLLFGVNSETWVNRHTPRWVRVIWDREFADQPLLPLYVAVGRTFWGLGFVHSFACLHFYYLIERLSKRWKVKFDQLNHLPFPPSVFSVLGVYLWLLRHWSTRSALLVVVPWCAVVVGSCLSWSVPLVCPWGQCSRSFFARRLGGIFYLS